MSGIDIAIFFVLFNLCGIVFLLAKKYPQGSDFYFHRLMIQTIKKEGVGSLSSFDRVIKKSTLNYPFLMHYIVSLFSNKIIKVMENYFSFIAHLFYALVTFSFIYYHTANVKGSFLATALYLCSPMFYSCFSRGPRVMTFSPRIFGELLGMAFFLFLYQYLMTANYWNLVLCILFSAAAILASRFALQALVLGAVFLSLLTGNFFGVVAIVVSYGLLFFITKGASQQIVKAHLLRIKQRVRSNLNNKMSDFDRGSPRRIVRLVKDFNFKGLLSCLLKENQYCIVVFKFPVFLLALYLTAVDIYSGKSGILLAFMSSIIAIYFLINIKWFKVIGESHRYINFFFPFIGLYLIQSGSPEVEPLIFITFALSVVFMAIDFYTSRQRSGQANAAEKELTEFLNEFKDPKNVATIPFIFGKYRVLTDTKHNYLYSEILWSRKEDIEKIDEFIEKYPYLSINKLPGLVKEYDLDIVAIRKGLDENINGQVITPDGFCVYEKSMHGIWLKGVAIQ